MNDIQRINVWYDKAWNNLEVIWESKVGNCYYPTENRWVDVLVDDAGNLSGFMVWGVTKIKDGEVANVELTPAELPQPSPEPAAAP